MGWLQYVVSILRAGNTIINPNGIFVYNGPPASGNLIVSIAPAAGTDDFGNAFPQGFKCTVGLFAVPNVIVNASGLFVYSATPAAGNLTFSFAPASGTDSFGNNFLPGFTVYDNLGLLATQFALPLLPLQLLTMTANPGAVFTIVTNSASYQFGSIGSPATFTPFIQPSIVLAASNGVVTTNGLSAGQFMIGIDSSANQALSYAAGTDGNVYRLGKTNLQVNQTLVNSTAFSTVATFAATPGKYHVRGNMRYTGSQAAGSPAFQVQFTGTSSEVTELTRWSTTGNPESNKSGIFIAFSSADIGPTLLAGTNQWYNFEFWTIVTATGSLNFQAAIQTAGDTFNINRLFIEIEHT